MGVRPTDVAGVYSTGSLTRLAPSIYSTDGLTEDPTRSHLYSFNIGDYAYPVLEPIPHVEMVLFDFDDATATITLWRTVGKRTMPVRGFQNVPVADGVNVVDWDAPFGVPLTYWATEYDVDGIPLGNTTPSVTQLDVARTWIHNPLDPAGAVPVELARGAAAKIPRPQDSDIAWPDGTGLAVAVTGQRHGVTGTPVVFYTLTDEDSDSVEDILGDPYATSSGPMVICIRTAAQQNTRWPRPFYALVDLEEQPVNQPAGGQVTRWEGTGTEVDPPAVALIAAVLTYEDLDAAYPSYEAMDNAYGSYLERDRDYRLAGTADTTTDPIPGGTTALGIYGAGIYGS